MALPVWPAGLPQKPLRDGYTAKAEPSLIKSEMSSGLVRQRRRFSQAVRVVSVTYSMTSGQLVTFRSFLNDTIGHGAGMFTGPVWDGSAFVTKSCQIIDGQVSEQSLGLHTQVSFSMRVIGL